MTAPSEAERLALTIERLIISLARHGSRLAAGDYAPLTLTQALALAIVVDGGPIRQRHLADELTTSEATASRTIDALERLRLAERRPDAVDRRGVVVTATRAGRDRIHHRRRQLVELANRMLAELDDDERGRIADLLDSWNDILEHTDRARTTPEPVA